MSEGLAGPEAGGRGGDVVRAAARAFERDRYLAALLAPPAVREDLIALGAFAGEVARVPSIASEPMIGEIRLQWWRDAIAAAGGDAAGAAGHPIAEALLHAMRRHALPATLLLGIVDAHADRLADVPFEDGPALTANLAKSEGALFALAWRILAGNDRPAQEPALLAAAGQAYGIARLLLELPAVSAERRTLLPADLMSASGLDLDRLGAPGGAPGRARAIAVLADEAERHVGNIRRQWRTAPRALRQTLLPVALVRPYLKACQKAVAPGLESGDVAPIVRVWRLWAAHSLGRV